MEVRAAAAAAQQQETGHRQFVAERHSPFSAADGEFSMNLRRQMTVETIGHCFEAVAAKFAREVRRKHREMLVGRMAELPLLRKTNKSELRMVFFSPDTIEP